jgi:hypothetical protein
VSQILWLKKCGELVKFLITWLLNGHHDPILVLESANGALVREFSPLIIQYLIALRDALYALDSVLNIRYSFMLESHYVEGFLRDCIHFKNDIILVKYRFE